VTGIRRTARRTSAACALRSERPSFPSNKNHLLLNRLGRYVQMARSTTDRTQQPLPSGKTPRVPLSPSSTSPRSPASLFSLFYLSSFLLPAARIIRHQPLHGGSCVMALAESRYLCAFRLLHKRARAAAERFSFETQAPTHGNHPRVRAASSVAVENTARGNECFIAHLAAAFTQGANCAAGTSSQSWFPPLRAV